MKIEKIHSPELGETYYSVDHPSGLRIMVMPKEDYSSAYAIFGTKYGSINTCFKLGSEENYTTVPEGIAHFLEHKLFESEDLDAFERYAKTGASANAFTTFDKTCYLFSCTDHFHESLEILLDFVQHPYFTKETVEKEQGIIGQEIRMYDDVPNWKVLFNLLRGMYHSHPVRIDISGTVESIAEITDELLYRCYNTFYNLSNMALCIVGNVELEEVLKTADQFLIPAKEITIDNAFPEEPDGIVTPQVHEKLAVAVPVFAFGYKETYEGPPTLKEQVETSILLQVLAGKTSVLYNRLFREGLVNTSFSSEYFTGPGYASIIFEGESKDPAKVAEAIKEEVRRLRKEGVDPAIFEGVRRKLYGRTIMAYNDIENIANGMITSYFQGFGLFDDVELYKNVTVADIERRLSAELQEERSVLSVIDPQ